MDSRVDIMEKEIKYLKEQIVTQGKQLDVVSNMLSMYMTKYGELEKFVIEYKIKNINQKNENSKKSSFKKEPLKIIKEKCDDKENDKENIEKEDIEKNCEKEDIEKNCEKEDDKQDIEKEDIEKDCEKEDIEKDCEKEDDKQDIEKEDIENEKESMEKDCEKKNDKQDIEKEDIENKKNIIINPISISDKKDFIILNFDKIDFNEFLKIYYNENLERLEKTKKIIIKKRPQKEFSELDNIIFLDLLKKQKFKDNNEVDNIYNIINNIL